MGRFCSEKILSYIKYAIQAGTKFFLFVFLLIMVIMIVHFKVLLIVMRVIPWEVLFKKKKSYILQEVYLFSHRDIQCFFVFYPVIILSNTGN